MEVEKTPKSEILQQMSYTELKKLAKKHGIKGNMKAEKIIVALCSLESEDIECFSTPAQKEINSCRKNKERKFNEDMMTPLATPRRGTYSIESPPGEVMKCNEDKMTPLATPKTENGSSNCVKVENTSFASTAVDTSVLNISNVTVSRGSERKSRRKVSFMSPVGMQSTPKNSSIKLRPRTPIASRASLSKRVSFSSPAMEQKRRSSGKLIRTTPHPRKPSEKSLRLTPSLRSSFFEEHSGLNISEINAATCLSSVTELPEKQDITPSIKQSENVDSKSNSKIDVSKKNITPLVTESSKKQYSTRSKQSQMDVNKPDSTMPNVSKIETAAKIKHVATPSSTMSSVPKNEASAKLKRAATPNFKKIHERAFEKMESIDDYQKRKEENSVKKINARPNFKSKIAKAKSKIPAFSGIPFIPSVRRNVCKTLDYDLNRTKMAVSTDKEFIIEAKKAKNLNESVQKSKTKFDLKTSLSRKLGYKPYKGPLKPLAESNILNTTNVSCVHKPKEPINNVVKSKRLQNRSILKGVRTNKRFELQMKNRALK